MDIDGNGFAGLISMAQEGADFMGADCLITGWGMINFGKSLLAYQLFEILLITAMKITKYKILNA